MRNEVEMREVDGRNDERNERIAAVVLCVGEDGDVGLDELELCGESQLAIASNHP